MAPEAVPRWKLFPTSSTWIHVFSFVSFTMNLQTTLWCKPLVTHCTQIRPRLVILWTLRDITAISFSLYLKWTPCIFTDAYVHGTSIYTKWKTTERIQYQLLFYFQMKLLCEKLHETLKIYEKLLTMTITMRYKSKEKFTGLKISTIIKNRRKQS